MKTDARIRYTRKVIKESFFDLMQDKPINKITVKSICDLAEINRATFYKYYSDPFDLLEQIEDELIIKMQQLIETTDNQDITQTLIIILNAVKNNAEMYMILTSKNSGSDFFDRIILENYLIKKPIMEELLPSMSPVHHEWFYNFMVHGFTNILITWIKNGMKEEPSEVANFINKLNIIMLKEIR